MNLKESVTLTAGKVQVIAGCAPIAYMRKLLEGGQYRIFAADPVGGTDAAPVIRPAVEMTSTLLESLERRNAGKEFGDRITEFDVIIVPSAAPVDDDLKTRAIERLKQQREERRRSDEGKANAVNQAAAKLYRECRGLIEYTAHIPANAAHIDPVTLRAVMAVDEAVDELLDPVSRAIRDLENGGGGIFSAFDDIPQPDEDEVRIALLAALKATLGCHCYNLAIRSLGYERSEAFPLFSTEDMERIFVGTFLSYIGIWGRQGLEGHEARSTRYVELICHHSVKVPDIVELVRAHGHADWISAFVYRIMVLDRVTDSESVYPLHLDYQRSNTKGLEAEIKASYVRFARALAPIGNGVDADKVEVVVERMDPRFVRDALMVAISDAFTTATEILGASAEEVVEELTDRYAAVSEPRSPVGNGTAVPSLYGVVLAAVANTLNVIPERSVLELRENRPQTRATRMLGLSGGRAVCLSRPSDAASDTLAPYLWLFGHADLPAGQFLKPPNQKPSVPELCKPQTGVDGVPCRCFISLGSQTSKRVYGRRRRLILWIMDAESYAHHFDAPRRLIPAIRKHLRHEVD